MRALTAAEMIRLLDLKAHPEGGHFRETFRDSAIENGRAASTAIYFLLARGERSQWHRVDTAELWHYYAGAPLVLEMAANEDGPIRRMKLGPDIAMGERAAGHRAGEPLAGGGKPRRLDAGRLHGRPRI